jgi:MFS family permease
MFGTHTPIGPPVKVEGVAAKEPYSVEELNAQRYRSKHPSTLTTPTAPATGDHISLSAEAEAPAAAAYRCSGSRNSSTLPPSYLRRLDAGFRPWKVVIGCFCLTVAVYGLLSSIGLFQTYWHGHQLRHKAESEISWVISVFGFLDCFCGVLAGVLFDRFGIRWLLSLASVVYVGAFVGLAFSSTYGQFMGCFVAAGIAAGLFSLLSFTYESGVGCWCWWIAAPPTTVAFCVVSQWFSKREGIATGCVTLGAAVGGIGFSLLLQVLFDRLQWRDGMLVLAGVLAVLMAAGSALVEVNLVDGDGDVVEREGEWGGKKEGGGKQCKKLDGGGGSGSGSGKGCWEVLGGLVRDVKFWLVTYAVFGEFFFFFSRALLTVGYEGGLSVSI